ncbi:transcription factor ATOH8 [Parasteatoda tepidariorum]|uniref:transcription factor ATOH8 n=1 Tax=Parasteatoda tepidariorum TaxID=114398 RepID=UPI00077F8E94|nr:protein atonal homolog 8 [Parasteatoda tepidariorum]
MACSPGCSSASPSTSMAHETDAFSDDSGVDVKPQERLLKFSRDLLVESSSRRNKRKSSEPKKRKDVLQMKRFRWDTDDEDNDLDKEDEDVDDVFERERPSSGDSGCQMAPSTSLDLTTKKAGEILNLSTKKTVPKENEKRKKQWRKPKTVKNPPDIKKEPFRQSVIRKHDLSAVSSRQQETTNEHSLPGYSGGMVAESTNPEFSNHEFALELVNGQEEEEEDGRTHGRPVGRPRNYKSMSRQRRIEANARERTRVHTISAAFENLRRAVPAYAHNQKLSKLAILRIASAYILALACLNDQDYSQDQSGPPSLSDCVEQCTRTIQAEGRSRRRSTKD